MYISNTTAVRKYFYTKWEYESYQHIFITAFDFRKCSKLHVTCQHVFLCLLQFLCTFYHPMCVFLKKNRHYKESLWGNSVLICLPSNHSASFWTIQLLPSTRRWYLNVPKRETHRIYRDFQRTAECDNTFLFKCQTLHLHLHNNAGRHPL